MIPVTPPPNDTNGFTKGTDHGRTISSNEIRATLPTPPLYYKTNDEQRGRKSQGNGSPVVIDNYGNRFVPPSPPFVPVHDPEESCMMQHSYQAFTPPISPYHVSSKKAHSPVPSLMSSSTSSETQVSDATTYYSWTSSPSTCYFIAGSPSSYTGNAYASAFSSPAAAQSAMHIPSNAYNVKAPAPKTKTSPSKTKVIEDPSRKQRIKTELCMHFAKDGSCPFGSECTYAHGEVELKKKRLMELLREGLIEDVTTYRTRSCFTWVTTGSCPFGIRCSGIHDPRISGPSPSWLPHTETQGNSLSTDINVDGLHQKRMHAIHHGSPFGDQFSLELDDFTDLYKLVCNICTTNKRRRNTLSEIHKLAIALQMRGESDWMYKYCPQHVINNTLCMVIQKRAFYINKSGQAYRISLKNYKANNPRHVLVHELAFGPDSDPTVHGVALYFNISESDVVQCTPQQAKRFRWKKNTNNLASNFDYRECFKMIRPYDRDAYELATSIMRHRWEVLKAERLSILNSRFEAIDRLDKEKELLKSTFLAYKRNWINWYWPVSNGRQIVDDDTPVPPVDTEYLPTIDEESVLNRNKEVVKGSAIQNVWDSFVSSAPFKVLDEEKDEEKVNTGQQSGRKRLRVFEHLGDGFPIDQDRSLPHITTKMARLSLQESSSHRQSERCWKDLLLLQDEEEQACNEWNIVKERFQKANARVKKVLDIVQN